MNRSMKRMVTGTALTALLVTALLLLSGVGVQGVAANQGASPDTSAPGQYCQQQGGVVQTRTAMYGTNGPNPLRLAGIRSFCQFTLANDGSRIHVELNALYSTRPTLAALAYYAKVQWDGKGNGNPGSLYCTQLGGSDQFGGTTGAGGGWVKKNTTDLVLEACIFPDMSSIDSWGLLYHSVDIIRGQDLDGVLRYPKPFARAK